MFGMVVLKREESAPIIVKGIDPEQFSDDQKLKLVIFATFEFKILYL
jgi:hypothetical protein